MKRHAYRWTHIPTGATGTRTAIFTSEKVFLACIDAWNGQSADWKYVTTDQPDLQDHADEADSIIFAGPFYLLSA